MNEDNIAPPDPVRVNELNRPRWFVCTANPQRMTHSLRDKLNLVGAEYYMALGNTTHIKNNEMLDKEVSLLGSFFFVRTSLRNALKLKSDFGLDFQYVRDRQKQLLWVPDSQFDDFKLVIETMPSKVNFNADLYTVGDPVVVTRGPLCGVHGILTVVDDSRLELLLKVPGVLAISVKIAKSNVRRVAKLPDE